MVSRPTSLVALHINYIFDSLRLGIIAEGIGGGLQAQFLCEHGVQFGQSWFFHAAIPIEAPPGMHHDEAMVSTSAV